jgi:hypothetical protein
MAFCVDWKAFVSGARGFWLLATGYWLLAVSSDLRLRPQTVIRNPFTVYRLSHRMINKVRTHDLCS